MSQKYFGDENISFKGILPSMEELCNSVNSKEYQSRLSKSGSIDLRDNHIIEELPDGKIRIRPIDKNKRVK